MRRGHLHSGARLRSYLLPADHCRSQLAETKCPSSPWLCCSQVPWSPGPSCGLNFPWMALDVMLSHCRCSAMIVLSLPHGQKPSRIPKSLLKDPCFHLLFLFFNQPIYSLKLHENWVFLALSSFPSLAQYSTILYIWTPRWLWNGRSLRTVLSSLCSGEPITNEWCLIPGPGKPHVMKCSPKYSAWENSVTEIHGAIVHVSHKSWHIWIIKRMNLRVGIRLLVLFELWSLSNNS